MKRRTDAYAQQCRIRAESAARKTEEAINGMAAIARLVADIDQNRDRILNADYRLDGAQEHSRSH